MIIILARLPRTEGQSDDFIAEYLYYFIQITIIQENNGNLNR